MTDQTSGYLDPVLRYQLWTALYEDRLRAAQQARERAERLGVAQPRRTPRRPLFRRGA